MTNSLTMIHSGNGNPLLPYTETRLPNGLTLVHKRVPVAPIVAIDVWIHTGAIHDPESAMGLSHFYEHMFFKGTERFKTGEMDRIITSLGGYNNAATSLDYTHYYAVLPSAGWRSALAIMLDALLHPLFDPDEIERERSVILEEIKRHEDNPLSKIYDEFIGASFTGNRYQRKVLGTAESLHTITRDTFFRYLRERYHPENMTLCVVGDVERGAILEAVAELFPETPSVPFMDPEFDWPLIDSPREITLERDVNQAYLLLGHPMPRTLGSRDEYAMDLLSMILGEGRSSRLYRRLIEQLGLVSSISCTSWNLKYAGLFLIEAVTEVDKIERVEQIIQDEVSRIRDDLNESELRRAKSMQRADFAFSNEKVASIAHTYGYSRMAIGIDHAVHYLEEMEHTTLSDVHSAYDAYIRPVTRCRGLLLPSSGKQ